MMLNTSAGFTGRAVTRTSTSPAAHLGTGASSHLRVLVGSAGLNAVTTTRCMVAGAMLERVWEGSGRKRPASWATRVRRTAATRFRDYVLYRRLATSAALRLAVAGMLLSQRGVLARPRTLRARTIRCSALSMERCAKCATPPALRADARCLRPQCAVQRRQRCVALRYAPLCERLSETRVRVAATTFSPLINGCWTLAGGHGRIEPAAFHGVMDAHIKAGFTTFDTAARALTRLVQRPRMLCATRSGWLLCARHLTRTRTAGHLRTQRGRAG